MQTTCHRVAYIGGMDRTQTWFIKLHSLRSQTKKTALTQKAKKSYLSSKEGRLETGRWDAVGVVATVELVVNSAPPAVTSLGDLWGEDVEAAVVVANVVAAVAFSEELVLWERKRVE
ncbi:unnamed protein product [Dibothriocephalus latus]|uniref:Uncharacterized protein n=1 Tax=Dibothriocephalus latus TaxID=60516 RepID=A0A3P7NMA0_DIBLA|nr:unnamed protein product [Dibothriocephalus latus]